MKNAVAGTMKARLARTRSRNSAVRSMAAQSGVSVGMSARVYLIDVLSDLLRWEDGERDGLTQAPGIPARAALRGVRGAIRAGRGFGIARAVGQRGGPARI